MTLDEAIIHAENVALNSENGLHDAIALGGQNPSQEEIDECMKCAEEHRQLAEWLKELKQHRWIPVSERLPEDTSKPVLISGNYKGLGVYAVDIARYNGGMWQYDGFTFPDCDILAWMPLPEPYREDGEA